MLNSNFIPCAVCNKVYFRPLFSIASKQIVECKKCGHEYVNQINSSVPRDYYFGNAEENEIQTEIDMSFLIRIFKKYDLMNCRLLDLGCGQGRIEHGLIKQYWSPDNLYLQDISESALRNAKKTLGLKNIFCVDAIKNIPSNDSFDCILAIELLEDIPQPRIIMQKALDVLRPGGFFILRGLPNNRSLEAFLAKDKWKMRIIDVHYNFFNPETFNRFIDTFQNLRVLEFGCFLQPGYRFYNVIRIAKNLGIYYSNLTDSTKTDEFAGLILEKLKKADWDHYPLKERLPVRKILNLVSKQDIEDFFDSIHLDYMLSPDFSVILRKEN